MEARRKLEVVVSQAATLGSSIAAAAPAQSTTLTSCHLHRAFNSNCEKIDAFCLMILG